MTLNFPGPYEVRMFYTIPISGFTPLTHVARYNVRIDGNPDPGTAFADIDVLRRDDSPFALDGEIDDWVTMIKGLWSSTSSPSIDYAELWKYTPESFDASFVSTYPIAVTTTSASPNVVSGQSIVTFRTMGGGIMKLNFMETIILPTFPDTLPFSNATLDAIADAVVAGTVPWLARDTTYPFACIAAYTGTNEALFKKRYGRH
jgi:hypothetical protein